MNGSAARTLGPWATFGILMLVSLAAWGLGSPELGLMLALGAMGALFVALDERFPLRHVVRRIIPIVRHHV